MTIPQDPFLELKSLNIITLPKAQWWSLDYEGTGVYFNTVHIGFCDYIRGLGTNLALLTTSRAMTDLFK